MILIIIKDYIHKKIQAVCYQQLLKSPRKFLHFPAPDFPSSGFPSNNVSAVCAYELIGPSIICGKKPRKRAIFQDA